MNISLGTIAIPTAFYQEVPEDPSEELAMFCNRMGQSYWRQNKLKEAVAGYEQAVEIGTMTGDTSANAAKSLVNLAKVYSLQGEFEKALGSLKQAMALYSAALGDDHPDVAECFFRMGCVSENMGRLDEALEHHMRALELRLVFLGKGHPQVAMSCNGVAGIHKKLGNLEVALERYEEALAIFIASLGSQNVYVAGTLCNVAEVHAKQDRLDQAMDCYKHVLESMTADMGALHPGLVCIHVELGTLLERKTHFKEARSHFAIALATTMAECGTEHDKTKSLQACVERVDSGISGKQSTSVETGSATVARLCRRLFSCRSAQKGTQLR